VYSGFIRPGALGVDLGCFLCDTARMARLIAALVFKLISSFCRRLFLCSAGGDLIARSYLMCVYSSATEGTLNGVTEKKFCFEGRPSTSMQVLLPLSVDLLSRVECGLLDCTVHPPHIYGVNIL
jgi:hypothetical protein